MFTSGDNAVVLPHDNVLVDLSARNNSVGRCDSAQLHKFVGDHEREIRAEL